MWPLLLADGPDSFEAVNPAAAIFRALSRLLIRVGLWPRAVSAFAKSFSDAIKHSPQFNG
jgi:hypothetical protein